MLCYDVDRVRPFNISQDTFLLQKTQDFITRPSIFFSNERRR